MHAFNTSCPATPPKKAAMGDKSPALVNANERQISSHLSSLVFSNKATTASTSLSAGKAPLFWARHFRSAVKALWSVPGLSNFAKSHRRNASSSNWEPYGLWLMTLPPFLCWA